MKKVLFFSFVISMFFYASVIFVSAQGAYSITCQSCSGSGKITTSEQVYGKCSTCYGQRFIRSEGSSKICFTCGSRDCKFVPGFDYGNTIGNAHYECNYCGSGEVYNGFKCTTCNGTGKGYSTVVSKVTCTRCNGYGSICVNHSYGSWKNADNMHYRICSVCQNMETAYHIYDYDCDAICDDCGQTRTASNHTYSNNCDATCDFCGTTRSITHTYGGDCDISCNVCGTIRTASGKHTFNGGVMCQICNATFEDVDITSWMIAPVSYACDRGLMAGKGTDANGNIKFDPNSPISREEFVQVLYNAENKPSISIANKFPDVAAGGWYKNAVLWANQAGIASGMGDGRFGVGKNITRQDLALMLYKYAAMKNLDLTAPAGEINKYADGDKVSGYAQTAMNWAVKNGVLSGKGVAGKPLSTFKLDPAGTATRAECAAMLKNFMTAFGL